MREGFYIVTGRGEYGEIEMNTAGSGEVYKHALVNYANPSHYYDSGWYAWFYDSCPLAEWNKHIILPPVVDYHKPMSIQHKWMKNYLEGVAKAG